MNVMGWIPTGWYPTAIVATQEQIFILNAKGNAVPDSGNAQTRDEGILAYKGSLEIVPTPTINELGRYTQLTMNNTPFFSRRLQTCKGRVVPDTISEQSPIRHVFFIIKGNATYDGVFGDIAGGNGSAALCEYPESVTPNQHALARSFVLLDNFYADGDMTADGLNWTLGSYAGEYLGRMIPAYYGKRSALWTFTGQNAMTMTKVGLLWDYCDWKQKKMRIYGTFTFL